MDLNLHYILGILLMSKGVAAGLPKLETCSESDTFFKHRYVYTYKYTAKTSSSFVGTTDSSSGSRIKCKVSLSVPSKCELVMKLSGCALAERQPGEEELYTKADQSDQFADDLERYALYFQMNKGVVVDKTIVTDIHESLETLNFKRGILSALQFQIKDTSEYDQQQQQMDVFGTCPAKYMFSKTQSKTVTTYRNLRDCQMVQIFRKQLLPPGTVIRTMTGGLMEGEISEGYYPFQSDVTCSYEFNNRKRMSEVFCHQNHYFKPTAFHGKVISTAMANVTQSLTLKQTAFSKPDPPDPKKFTGSVKQIVYDFGETEMEDTTLVQLQESMESLVEPFVADDNEDVPRLYGSLVEGLRHSSADVIRSFMMDIFSCDGESCPDEKKAAAQKKIYLDGLETCGTDTCILELFHCISHNHVPIMMTTRFLHSLTQLSHLSEDVQAALLDYCKASGKVKCWLSLGAVLSSGDHAGVEPIETSSTLGETLGHIGQVLDDYVSESGSIPNEDIVMFAKTLSNIGSEVISKYYNQFIEEELIINKVLQCLKAKGLDKSARRALIKTISHWFEELGFKQPGHDFVETLFDILEDVTMDTTARGMAFSFLMKTTDDKVIDRMVSKMLSDDTEQFKKYMRSCREMFRQDDLPAYKKFREAWKKNRDRNHWYIPRPDLDIGAPKSWRLLRMYKLAVTEFFGAQVYADLLFDPADHHFSTLSVGLNYIYNEEKQNIMEFTVNIHGFSLLMDVIAKRINLTPQQLYKMYQAAAQTEHMGDEERKLFADFQQDIVKSVINILDTVNHGGMTDFDISFELVTKGKEVGYVSLQDVISYIRMMKRAAPSSQHSAFGKLMQDLRESKFVPLFKCTEFAGITKVFPTCAGLPLNMTVRALGMNKVYSSVQSNVALFLAKQTRALSGSLKQYITFNNIVFGQLMIPVGRYHSSGIRMEIPFGTERDATFRLTYGHKEPGPDGHFPKHPRLQVDLEPLSSDKDKEPIFYARGSLYLLQHSGKVVIQPDTKVEKDVSYCNSPKYQMALGRSFCVNLRFPAVMASQRHAYFPLSGPFDLSVEMGRVDNVGAYSIVFDYIPGKERYGRRGHTLSITHSGKGDTLDRLVNMNITAGRGGFTIQSSAPEFGLRHEAVLRLGFFNFEIKDFIWLNGKPFLGYILKADEVFNYNVTIPGASWDLLLGWDYRLEDGKRIAERSATASFYCTKQRPFLYLLHWDPMNVAANDFVTKIGYRHKFTNNAEDGQTFEFVIGDQIITLVDKPAAKDGFFLNRIWKLSFKLGDEEVTLDGNSAVNMATYDCGGEEECPRFDGNLILDSDQYNVVITGDVKRGSEEVEVSATLDCTNKDLSTESNRLRRSIKDIYRRFRQLEEAAVEGIVSLEKEILGQGLDEEQADLVEVHVEQGTLPDIIPTFPSIWDLKSWQAELDLSVQMPTQTRDRRDYHTVLKLHHPWSGGYVDLHQELSIGHLIEQKFYNFGMWMNGSHEVLFSNMDGSPFILPNGEPMIVNRRGDAHVKRSSGHFFTVGIHHYSPMLELNYDINFDWDAASHHEPLYHVKSSQTNGFMPFLNHQFEEAFSYEPKHLKHIATFEHKILKVNLETDLYDNPYTFNQKGDFHITINAFQIDDGMDFVHKITAKDKVQVDSEFTFHSAPDKTILVNIQPISTKTVSITTNVKTTQSPDAIPLWKLDISATDLTLREAALEWYPAYDAVMKARLEDPYYYILYLVHQLGARLEYNRRTPFTERTVPFTSVTVQSLMKEYMMPMMVGHASNTATFMANIVPLKERMKMRGRPGPKIPVRLALLLRELKNLWDTSDDDGSSLVLMPRYSPMAVRALTLLAHRVSQVTVAKIGAEEILQKRKIVWGWTGMFIVDDVTRPPDSQLALVYLLDPIFRRRSRTPRTSSSAAVFSREHGPLYFKTLDQQIHEIPVSKSEDCTYLLSADVSSKTFAVIHSPSALSVLTRHMTVSVDNDGYVFIDNCKHPRLDLLIESPEGDVKVVQTDEMVEVELTSGLHVVCYKLSSHLCVMTLTGSYRNGTIGLFGTNDQNSFTDPRLPSGGRASDTGTWLSGYALAGPPHCYTGEHKQEPSDDNVFYNPYYWNCTRTMSKTVGGWCQYSEPLKQVCKAESKREGVKAEDTCYIYEAAAGFCKPTKRTLPDFCSPSPLVTSDSDPDGSLDIVFVVSQHKSMLKNQKSAMEYISDLIKADWSVGSSLIRMAVVTFGGSGDLLQPKAHRSDGNGYFINMEDYDESMFEGIRTDGDGDQDAFAAIDVAADLPFSPTRHKLIVTLMTKEQAANQADNLDALKNKLLSKGIVFNLVSSHGGKVIHGGVIGLSWDSKTITKHPQISMDRDIPDDDYMDLVKATHGAVWHVRALKRGQKDKINRMVEEFYAQTIGNYGSCPN